jgi:hypothetical protein
LIVTHPDGESEAFSAFADQLAKKIFPQLPLKLLPADHPIYNSMYKLQNPAPIHGVSNGVRLLMVNLSGDLSRGWQTSDDKSFLPSFRAGANLYVYANGKDTLRNRLESPYIGPVLRDATATVPIARLKYNGNWNPEPEAWPRFARWFQRATSAALQITPIDITALKPQTAPLAHLTAVESCSLSDAEISALRAYVEAGGTLLIDPCGGNRALAQQLRSNVVMKIVPTAKPQMIRGDHAILNGHGKGMDDLSKPRVRPFTLEVIGAVTPYFDIVPAGDGAIIITDLDLTSGLLGTTTWGIAGYEPDYASAFLKNLILWCAQAH